MSEVNEVYRGTEGTILKLTRPWQDEVNHKDSNLNWGININNKNFFNDYILLKLKLQLYHKKRDKKKKKKKKSVTIKRNTNDLM